MQQNVNTPQLNFLEELGVSIQILIQLSFFMSADLVNYH